MPTTTVWSEVTDNSHFVAGIATIDSGQTATLAIPCNGKAIVRIGVPTIDNAALTFTVQPYFGATFRTLKNASGDVSISASTGGFVRAVPELSGCYAFTIVAGAAQNGGKREFEIQMVGKSPTAVS